VKLLSDTAVLLQKELQAEFRSHELLTTASIFILIVIVLFSFTFDPTSTESKQFGPGLLWLAFLFSASLMLQPSFLKEKTNDTLSALRLAVGDPFAIFLAKLTANTIFLLVTQLLLLLVFGIFFNIAVLPVFPKLAFVFFLGSLGVSTTGTALSAVSSQARMREVLLPILLLPLLVPVLIPSAEATRALFEPEHALRWDWLGILIAFDVVFLTALWLFGEYLLEE
jgi:heme exporter protein B